jgi:hypothetical protein
MFKIMRIILIYHRQRPIDQIILAHRQLSEKYCHVFQLPEALILNLSQF